MFKQVKNTAIIFLIYNLIASHTIFNSEEQIPSCKAVAELINTFLFYEAGRFIYTSTASVPIISHLNPAHIYILHRHI